MKKFLYLLIAGLMVLPVFSADEDESSLAVEEVIVTAERREASIMDTAISITAFDESLIETLNLRNQEDLQNFIPATTIQPYDISIRGIGRVFRALGGDPGVGTYQDGAYSEDFGIASTENALYDIARIEVLRGPQGTLYGRNSIGGAVNFISVKPSQEFAAEIKTIAGSYGTAEVYSFLNGPISDNLSARLIMMHRMRGGTVEDLAGHEDLDSYDDENYTLALRWENDNFTADVRGNARSYGRVLGSAQGAGLIVTSEYGGGGRNNDLLVHGYRAVDPTIACANTVDRTTPNCAVAGMTVHSFDYNGIQRYGQFLVPGVDASGSGFARPNYAYGYDQSILNATTIGDGTSVPHLSGTDLKASTNGFNDEYFNHSTGIINLAWDVNDRFTLKYIGSYTDYLYTRITDDDRTGNLFLDEQFYAEQENENWQNEIQLFWDITDDWNLTVGIFEYHNEIDQDLDFWTDTGQFTEKRQSAAANYGILGATGLPTIGSAFLDWYVTGRDASPLGIGDGTAGLFGPAIGTTPVVGASQTQVGTYSARDVGCGIVDLRGLVPTPDFSDPHLTSVCFLEGPWTGDTGGSVSNGPVTPGTTFIWQTENKTDAYAVYFQTEAQLNDSWALTVGASWHEDQKVAQENLFLYQETQLTPAGLFAYNVATGALNTDGTPTGNEIIRLRGIPMSRSIHRAMERDFEDVTYRVNVDYTPVDNVLLYLSSTTGYRAGGFNLGYFSPFPTYDQEEVQSTEFGYKGVHMAGALLINASIYQYNYENIHGQFVTQSFLGGTGTSVQGFPEADTMGIEGDFILQATDDLLIGGNASYTDANYSAEYYQPNGLPGVIDENNPYAPVGLYSIPERTVSMNGLQMLRIPKSKMAFYANLTKDALGGTVDYLLTYAWTDSINWDDSQLALDTSPPFSRMDFKVNWTNNEETLEVMAFLNNIQNKVGIRNMTSDGEQLAYQRSVTPTLPRMAGIGFTYKFGN